MGEANTIMPRQHARPLIKARALGLSIVAGDDRVEEESGRRLPAGPTSRASRHLGVTAG